MAEPAKEEIPLPEVIPLKREVVTKYLDEHERCMKLLETWARIHLRALTMHPRTPIEVVDDLIDKIDHKAMDETEDKFFQRLGLVRFVKRKDANIDKMNLVEPAPKKSSIIGKVVKLFSKIRPKEEKEKEQDTQKQYFQREERDPPTYEELKIRFTKLLNEEVYRHRDARDAAMGEQATTSENLESEDGRWIIEMNRRLHVSHLAFKLLGSLREDTDTSVMLLSFNDLGKDISFKGADAKFLQNRLAYLETTKTVALFMVNDIEKMRKDNETYAECVERFKQVLRSEREKQSPEEKKVIKCMEMGTSILDFTSPSHEKRAKNMLKSESQQNLTLSFTGNQDDLDAHSIFGSMVVGSVPVSTKGEHAELVIPLVVDGQAPITEKLLRCQKECPQPDPQPDAENSTSGYSSASHLSQSPADTLGDSSTHGGGSSFLNLPDSGRSRKEPTSKEASTSPVQTSRQDEDSTDNLTDIDKKLKDL